MDHSSVFDQEYFFSSHHQGTSKTDSTITYSLEESEQNLGLEVADEEDFKLFNMSNIKDVSLNDIEDNEKELNSTQIKSKKDTEESEDQFEDSRMRSHKPTAPQTKLPLNNINLDECKLDLQVEKITSSDKSSLTINKNESEDDEEQRVMARVINKGLKLIFMNLPPSLTSEKFLDLLGSNFPINYLNYRPPIYTEPHLKSCCAFVNFEEIEHAHYVCKVWENTVLLDENNGKEYLVYVLYSPNQDLPWKARKNPLKNTYKTTKAFQDFEAEYNRKNGIVTGKVVNEDGSITTDSMLKEIEEKLKIKPVQDTPLTEFIRNKEKNLEKALDRCFELKLQRNSEARLQKELRRKARREKRDLARKERREKERIERNAKGKMQRNATRKERRAQQKKAREEAGVDKVSTSSATNCVPDDKPKEMKEDISKPSSSHSIEAKAKIKESNEIKVKSDKTQDVPKNSIEKTKSKPPFNDDLKTQDNSSYKKNSNHGLDRHKDFKSERPRNGPPRFSENKYKKKNFENNQSSVDKSSKSSKNDSPQENTTLPDNVKVNVEKIKDEKNPETSSQDAPPPSKSVIFSEKTRATPVEPLRPPEFAGAAQTEKKETKKRIVKKIVKVKKGEEYSVGASGENILDDRPPRRFNNKRNENRSARNENIPKGKSENDGEPLTSSNSSLKPGENFLDALKDLKSEVDTVDKKKKGRPDLEIYRPGSLRKNLTQRTSTNSEPSSSGSSSQKAQKS